MVKELYCKIPWTNAGKFGTRTRFGPSGPVRWRYDVARQLTRPIRCGLRYVAFRRVYLGGLIAKNIRRRWRTLHPIMYQATRNGIDKSGRWRSLEDQESLNSNSVVDNRVLANDWLSSTLDLVLHRFCGLNGCTRRILLSGCGERSAETEYARLYCSLHWEGKDRSGFRIDSFSRDHQPDDGSGKSG